MPYTNIDSPKKYFEAKTYTGNGSSQSITGLSFSPDFVWVKDRTSANSHNLSDIVRGATKTLFTDATNAEVTDATRLTSFNSDGFSVGSSGSWNTNGNNYVSWNWDANGAGVSNTQGSITSTVSANTTSGFSIVSYTGNGTSGATIGHGLGAKPAMIIFKNRIDSVSAKWAVYHQSAFVSQADPNILYLDDTAATADDVNVLGNTTVTLNSTVFSLGNYNGTNGNGDGIIAYCFAEVKGYSKFGSYTGNGSSDGTFIYTGFKPAFLIVKRYNDAGYDWLVYDNKRQVEFNVVDDFLNPNLSSAETTGNANQSLDFLSNGVKFRGLGASSNGSGASYIYMAFASNPFVSSKGIPCTAR